jgi:hypothetical protein
MADLHKVSKQVADVAERLADVADAARGGQRPRRIGGMRWVLLPAAGAAAYAAAKRGLKGPARAKDVSREAKERAPEPPDLDLLGRVKEVVGVAEDDQQDRAQAQVMERGSRQPDSEQLERNREERAKRRQRRRERASA